MAGERSRTYSWEDPISVPQELVGLPGLDVMRMMVAGELPQAAIARTLDFRLVEVDLGRAVFECHPAEFHYNPIGTAHAGLASTLLDSAMGCALMTTLEAGMPWTTLELKANFTRAMTVDTGLVRCTGTVVHPGRTVATTEARIEGADGRLYAHGTSTILVLPR